MPSEIKLHFHCRKCIEEMPKGTKPKDWQSVEVGLTDEGFIQVWCRRHDMNIVTTEDEVTFQ
jgi:hypothetical protein